VQVASTKKPSFGGGGVRIVAGRKGMTDLSGGGSGASVINIGSNVNSNTSSTPKNLGSESDSDDDDDELESVICIQIIRILFWSITK
jgi:hypothetical protein